MAEEKSYRVLAEHGLDVTDEEGAEQHLDAGEVVPRSAFKQITWLLDQHLVEEIDPDEEPEQLPAEGSQLGPRAEIGDPAEPEAEPEPDETEDA